MRSGRLLGGLGDGYGGVIARRRVVERSGAGRGESADTDAGEGEGFGEGLGGDDVRVWA